MPLWLKLEGSSAIIRSNDILDQEDSLSIVVTLEYNGVESTKVFTATLECQSSDCVSESRTPEAIPNVGCDNGLPLYLDPQGKGGENEYGVFVPVRYYMLTKFLIFSNNEFMSGFELTFTPYPADQFINWDDATYLYGTSDGTSSQSLEFTQDLQEL